MSDLSRRRQPAGAGIQICFEHHAPEKWTWLADRAAELGVSFVRLGEFVWDSLETQENSFYFEELDGFIQLLAARGIDTVLTTPTASPPDWLCSLYPEIVPRQIDGRSFGTGVRRHTCPTSPRYRESCERIVRAMARRYAASPSICGWQIDNEIGFPWCYCSLCHAAFQQWLKARFTTIEQFNFRAGQFFLGRTSRCFEEIPLPESSSNPGLHQLYALFMDHQIRECWGRQHQWLREEGVQSAINSNAMLTWYGYDHEKFFEPLDTVAGDTYPDTQSPGGDGYANLAFYSAYLRGIKHGANFGMMELRCGPIREGGAFPEPGAMRRWAYSFLAGGADYIHFFRLDTSPSGLERGGFGVIPPSCALLPSYYELRQLCGEIQTLTPLLQQTTRPTAPVGILYSHPCHTALQHKPCIAEFHGPHGNGYAHHLARHFRALASKNIAADVVYPGEDFRKYQVLVVSGHVVMGDDTAKKLASYVKSGGILLVWPWSGLYDENAKQREAPTPVGLTEVFGAQRLTTESFEPGKVTVEFSVQSNIEVGPLSCSVVDRLEVSDDAEVLAMFRTHPSGENFPAWTRNKYGEGVAYFLAAFFDEKELPPLYETLLERHGILGEILVSDAVQHTSRMGQDFDLHFYFNSSADEVSFPLPIAMTDLSGEREVRTLTLGAGGCAVLKARAGSSGG